MSALELLAGDAQTFRTKVWASRVHVHHTDPDDLAGLLTLDDVDSLLTSSGIRTPSVRIARDGAVLPEATYTRAGSLAGRPLTGLVDPRRALALFEDGATVVLQGLHRSWEPLADLVAALELELGHPCQANAYLTPPNSQGFAVHADSHDVFVFQTHGRKRWEIHADGTVDDLLLEPGLSVYLPTGTPHAARAQDGVSLHVTIGINQLTWRHLVDRTVRDLLAEVDEGHLPSGHLDDPAELETGLAERLDELAARIRGVDSSDAVARLHERFLTTRTPRLRGGLRAVLAARTLTDRTLLRRRSGSACRLVDAGERLVVLAGDRRLEMPARIRPAMEVVVLFKEFSPADLGEHGGLDKESRLVLCRRLLREGVLEVVG